MVAGVMPKRAAVPRSMVILSCLPLSSRSLETFSNSGIELMRSTSLGTQVLNADWFGFSRKNRYCALPTVLSMVRSCTGCIAIEMPATLFVSWLSRRMMSTAVSLRSSRGLSEISIRPLLSAVFTPSTPMNDERLVTSLSLRMTSARTCCRRAISANETSCAALVIP